MAGRKRCLEMVLFLWRQEGGKSELGLGPEAWTQAVWKKCLCWNGTVAPVWRLGPRNSQPAFTQMLAGNQFSSYYLAHSSLLGLCWPHSLPDTTVIEHLKLCFYSLCILRFCPFLCRTCTSLNAQNKRPWNSHLPPHPSAQSQTDFGLSSRIYLPVTNWDGHWQENRYFLLPLTENQILTSSCCSSLKAFLIVPMAGFLQKRKKIPKSNK